LKGAIVIQRAGQEERQRSFRFADSDLNRQDEVIRGRLDPYDPAVGNQLQREGCHKDQDDLALSWNGFEDGMPRLVEIRNFRPRYWWAIPLLRQDRPQFQNPGNGPVRQDTFSRSSAPVE
jgi:hypothetical protein